MYKLFIDKDKNRKHIFLIKTTLIVFFLIKLIDFFVLYF